MLVSWGISIWIARELGPANYGIFNLVLWLSNTISWALGMGFIHAITKFIAEFKGRKEEFSIRPIIFYVLKIEITITSITTLVLIFFRTEIADYFFSPGESFFFFLTALGLIPGIITAIFSAAIEGIQKFEFFTYSNLTITPLSFFAKILVLLWGKGISGLLCVMLIFSIINALFYAFILYREGAFTGKNNSLSVPVRQRINSYNKSILAILFCDKIVWDKSENFFLGRLCNAIEIGYYNLGYNITQRFMSIMPTVFWKVLFPKMSSYYGSGDDDKMKRLFYIATRYLAFFSFPVGTAGIILSYQIIYYLYGNEYTAALPVLQIIFFSSIISSLSNPASAILYGFEKQSFIYKYGFILAVINIILDILLIKSHGALGAAICNGITTILGSLGGLIYTCRIMKLRYPIVSIFKIIASTVVMGVTMQLILHHDTSVVMLVVATVTGVIIYLSSAILLGTVEDEDLFLFQYLKAMLPNKVKFLLTTIQVIVFKIKAIPLKEKAN